MRNRGEEVAGRVGLDVIVNAVLNHRREVAGLFVGDFIHAHRQAAGFALEAYGTAANLATLSERHMESILAKN